MSLAYPNAETGPVVPVWPDRPAPPDPLPGAKRYVVLRAGQLVFETDDREEALAAIVTHYLGDTLCDRQFKVNRYSKVSPIKTLQGDAQPR